ncbi:MAG: DUF4255 domain-containing protein [Bacteroidia bacterium]|nr:MAG: DUF4255 domain-containing protein [Bacteroidia bacterium]
MLYPVLNFLAEQMNLYIDQVKSDADTIASPVAVLDNIARLSEDDLESKNNILLSLVNISEETTMKNDPGHVIMNNDLVKYDNPPVNLNLSLLVTSCMTNYDHALIYLSHVITFFQGKHIFTRQNSVTQVDGLPEAFKIVLDLQTLTMEQVNYLWSTLGGKQHPFACYKARILQLERDSTVETRGVIRQVRIKNSGV